MKLIAAFFLLGILTPLLAQDDLLNELKDETKPDYALSTFKGTRVVNGHSVETKPGGALEFIISHRFGALNSGSYELWGLDVSQIRIGLEYGITDKLGLGIGRSSEGKIYDGYVKYKALRQSNSFPVTITALGTVGYKSLRQTPELDATEKLRYSTQLMIARKFSSVFSFQLTPAFVHRNAVDQSFETNNLVALGFGSKLRITRSIAVNAEYYLRLNENSVNQNNDAIGIGVDIETGGHVFQLVFTNAYGFIESAFIPETSQDFWDGDIHFGFNITRTFQLTRKK